MFLTFKNLVLYLSFLSSTCIPAPTHKVPELVTIIDFNALVDQEIVLLQNRLNEFKNANSTLDKISLEGKILGNLEQLIRRMINAEMKNDVLWIKLGALENEKELFAKILRILGARSRMEKLVDDLYPERRPFHVSVPTAYEKILTSTESKFTERSCIIVFRKRVSDYGISITDFIDSVRSLYSSMSDNVAHKMTAFDPVPPEYNDVEGIKEMYISYGITPDDAKVKTAQIILEPLPLLTTTTTEIPDPVH